MLVHEKLQKVDLREATVRIHAVVQHISELGHR
jgi:hypothetical protein